MGVQGGNCSHLQETASFVCAVWQHLRHAVLEGFPQVCAADGDNVKCVAEGEGVEEVLHGDVAAGEGGADTARLNHPQSHRVRVFPVSVHQSQAPPQVGLAVGLSLISYWVL